MLLTTYILRVGIAAVLLGGGVLWLARTTSIEELMLNAVALNSILDIDEFVFAGMTPIKIQHAIQNLTPIRIKYSRFRSQLEAFVHFTSLLALICASYFLLLVPLSDTMLSVKQELCGGLQTFVAGFCSTSNILECSFGCGFRKFRGLGNFCWYLLLKGTSMKMTVYTCCSWVI